MKVRGSTYLGRSALGTCIQCHLHYFQVSSRCCFCSRRIPHIRGKDMFLVRSGSLSSCSEHYPGALIQIKGKDHHTHVSVNGTEYAHAKPRIHSSAFHPTATCKDVHASCHTMAEAGPEPPRVVGRQFQRGTTRYHEHKLSMVCAFSHIHILPNMFTVCTGQTLRCKSTG